MRKIIVSYYYLQVIIEFTKWLHFLFSFWTFPWESTEHIYARQPVNDLFLYNCREVMLLSCMLH